MKKSDSFHLNGVELKRYKMFCEEHKQCVLSTGKEVSIIFIPTSIGTAVSIKCSICGKVGDITDYDNW